MNNIINSFWKDSTPPLSSSEESMYQKYFEVLKALARNNFGSIYMIDLKEQKLKFISHNPSLFAGLNSCEIEKLGYNFYRKYTEGKNLELLKKVNTTGFKFYETLPVEDKKAYTITYDFHMKDPSNLEVLINHKITPIELCDEGNISKAVCVASYSLSKTAGNMCVASNNSEIFWKYNFDTGKWLEKSKIKLKVREIEIIRLYLRGLKIEEIAEQLFVSPNTIKFHGSKLFEKIGVNNITEAISYVVSNNLI